MKIALRGGHNWQVTGANGIVNEVTEDRKILAATIKYLRQLGHEVIDVTPERTSTSAEDLKYGIEKANASGAEYGFSIHLNASNGAGNGTEVINYPGSAKGKEYGTRIVNKLSALGFKNRGAKDDVRSLYEPRNSKMTWNIIEVFFCDNQGDVDIYNRVGVDAVGRAIAEGVTGQTVSAPQPSAPATSATRTLGKGDNGEDVKVLQAKLNKVGNYGLTTDGDFGPKSDAAVRDFQTKNGLTVDGMVGPMTMAKIDAIIAEMNKPPVAPAIDYEVEICRILVNDVKVIALTGKTKCIDHAKANCEGHIKIQCVKDSAIIAEFDNALPKPAPVVEAPKVVEQPVPAPVVETPKHPIMGTADATAEQMAHYIIRKRPNPKISCPILELAKIYLEEGAIEGVRGDVAFAQAIKETGYFQYGGDVVPEQHNYAGIGTTGGGVKGQYFESPRIGVRAQIQHLKAYASKDGLKQECVDPRYKYVTKGIAPNWEDLNGRWAVPGNNYGQEILEIHQKLREEVVTTPIVEPIPTPEEPVKQPEPVKVTEPVKEPQETPVVAKPEPQVEIPTPEKTEQEKGFLAALWQGIKEILWFLFK